MTSALTSTAIVLVASGLSRRFGRKDKMLANLGGLPLVEHAAQTIAGLHPQVRVAVCPATQPEIGERLIDRFVVAVNKKPKQGLGHSIAVGVQVALQFKPEAIMVCMGDMPFIEPWLLEAMAAEFQEGRADILHAGAYDRPHPPTMFGKACFEQLAALDGDDGARSLMRSDALRIAAFSAPGPLLFDVDTREELALAEQQLAIRTRCYSQTWSSARAAHADNGPSTLMESQQDRAPASRVATR
jgi:molybdenum cofactor cytidylyltransferase